MSTTVEHLKERLQSPSPSPYPDLEDPHLTSARQAIVDRIEQEKEKEKEKEKARHVPA